MEDEEIENLDQQQQQQTQGEVDGNEFEDHMFNDQNGAALTAYQNEQITDYFHWNDNEGLQKKTQDQLQFLYEIDLEEPEQVMIDEIDRLEIVLDSSDEEELSECRITGTKPMLAKREMLYNLKKEIKVKS